MRTQLEKDCAVRDADDGVLNASQGIGPTPDIVALLSPEVGPRDERDQFGIQTGIDPGQPGLTRGALLPGEIFALSVGLDFVGARYRNRRLETRQAKKA